LFNQGQYLIIIACPESSKFGQGAFTLVVSLQVIQVIISLTIIALVLLQTKGSGLGGIFGGDGGVYRTRRGIEKTLYQATIGLTVLFFVVSLVSVAVSS
jgi:preprotein translocase subunit SecG